MNNKYLKPNRNCWKTLSTEKFAYLIDGQAYFHALREALKKATNQVIILSWDIDSRFYMVHDNPDDNLPSQFGELINELVKQKPELCIYILNWDYTMLFSGDREAFAHLKFDLNTHSRVIYRSDNYLPPGGCHHQKVVVIDDKIAFCGGLDITQGRWDTPSHTPDDTRRCDADGNITRPYHDVQIMLEGEIAEALGDLARNRWKSSQDEELKKPNLKKESIWPESIDSLTIKNKVAIARTICGQDGAKDIREIENLYHDSIAKARKYIYIENQYFTSDSIANSLIKQLQKKDGPDIIMVLPKSTEGWLANHTMDIRRVKHIKNLRKNDRFERFGIYYPHVEGLSKDNSINVHSKIMVIDDEFCRVGSSNLNDRSLGLDTECDIALEAGNKHEEKLAIKHLRDRLLAEHLDCESQVISKTVDEKNSLYKAIEHLRGQQSHTLCPLEPELTDIDLDNDLTSRLVFVDPYEPLDVDNLMKPFLKSNNDNSINRRLVIFASFLITLVGLVIINQFYPIFDFINPKGVIGDISSLDTHPGIIWSLTIITYIIAGLVSIPVTILVVTTVLIFGSLQGFFIALIGTNLSACIMFLIGHYLGKDFMKKFVGNKINNISEALASKGVLTMIIVRMVPIAPFSIINLVAGASHIRFFDYFFGTLLGMLPGLLAIALITDRVENSLRSPSIYNIIQLIIVTGAIILFMMILFKKIIPKIRK